MTDLEITKACAVAMGYAVELRATTSGENHWEHMVNSQLYEPLRDDLEAMALVKKFKLTITPPLALAPTWEASQTGGQYYEHADLNRAICQCVASLEAKE